VRQLRNVDLPLTVMVLFWAFNWIAVKVAFQQITPADFSAARWILMEVIVVGICLATGRSLRIEKGDLLPVLGVGFVNMGAYMVFFLLGLSQTTATEGAVILSTSPVMTYFLAVAVSQERFSLKALGGCLLAFLGVVLVVAKPSGAPHGNRLLGDGLLIGASLLMAWGSVLTRKVSKTYDPIRLFAISLPAALPALIPFVLLSPHSHWSQVQPISYLMLLHSAALSGVAAYCLFYSGIDRIGASGAMLYQNTVTAATALMAWAYFGTPVTLPQFVGIGLVVLGVGFAMRARSQANDIYRASLATDAN